MVSFFVIRFDMIMNEEWEFKLNSFSRFFGNSSHFSDLRYCKFNIRLLNDQSIFLERFVVLGCRHIRCMWSDNSPSVFINPAGSVAPV